MTVSGIFRSDNSNETIFGSKSGSDNKNVKKVMSEFKIRTKNSYPYSIFFESDKFLPIPLLIFVLTPHPLDFRWPNAKCNCKVIDWDYYSVASTFLEVEAAKDAK